MRRVTASVIIGILLGAAVLVSMGQGDIRPVPDGWRLVGGNLTTTRSVAIGTTSLETNAMLTVDKLALGTTSTAGLALRNTTASVVGPGATVQISPRFSWSGTAWDSDDNTSRTAKFFTEVLPTTGTSVGGSLKFGWVNPATSAVTYPLILRFDGDLTATASIHVGSSSSLQFATGARWMSSADGYIEGYFNNTANRGTLTMASYIAQGPNGQQTTQGIAAGSLTCNSGTGTCTIAPASFTPALPNGIIIDDVSVLVTTELSGAGPLTTFSVGDGTDPDRWGAGIARTVGTATTLANATITSVPIYATAPSIVLTAAAGQFDAGVVRVSVHYKLIGAAGS